MSETQVIPNPFIDQGTIPVKETRAYGALDNPTNGEASMDDLFNAEVNTAEAAEITKRNMAPAGTYVTEPEDYPPTVLPRRQDEKDIKGEITGQRLVATVIARATAKIKGDEVTQVLRFTLSPEQRHKKVYEGSMWTGEVDEGKDDLSSRLWANAVSCYEDFHGKGTSYKQQDVLEFLKAVPFAMRTMQGDRGELVVLSLSSRGRKR